MKGYKEGYEEGYEDCIAYLIKNGIDVTGKKVTTMKYPLGLYEAPPIPSEDHVQNLNTKRLLRHYRWTQEQMRRIQRFYVCDCCNEYLHTKDEENAKMLVQPFVEHEAFVKSILDTREHIEK